MRSPAAIAEILRRSPEMDRPKDDIDDSESCIEIVQFIPSY